MKPLGKPNWKFLLAFGAVLALAAAMLAALAFILERRSARDLEQALKRLRRPEYFSRYEALSARLAEDFGEDETSSHATGVSETWITEAVATVKAYEPLFAAYKERIEDDPDWEQFRWPDHSRGEPSAEVREAQEQFVTEHQDFIEQARRAAKLGDPVCPLDLSQGMAMEFPHLRPLRTCTKLLCWDALLQAQRGDFDATTEDFLAAMRLADALASEASLISQNVRVVLYETVFDGIRDAVQPGQLSSSHVESLVNHLAQAHKHEALVQSIYGDAWLVIDTCEALRAGKMAEEGKDPSELWFLDICGARA